MHRSRCVSSVAAAGHVSHESIVSQLVEASEAVEHIYHPTEWLNNLHDTCKFCDVNGIAAWRGCEGGVWRGGGVAGEGN